MKQNNEIQKKPEKEESFWRSTLETVALCAGEVAVLLVLFTFVWSLVVIPSESMQNTIMVGDRLIGTRYDRKDIQRYDIMIFHSPLEDAGEKEYYIKRVIGLPGETVTVGNGHVYVGNEIVDDSFLPEEMDGSGEGVYQVPEGCYFMMGDNRNNSLDARFWGEGSDFTKQYIPTEDMVAKAWLRIWPLNHFGSVRYDGSDYETVYADEADIGEDHIHLWTGAGDGYYSDEVGDIVWIDEGENDICRVCGAKREAS